jgi:NAD(P)-dependent dehydrogenase (short-subunit alcohol dehydrogenase family)
MLLAPLRPGVWSVDPQVTLQEDGLERMYATNYLQMCLFVEMLAPLLAKSTPARFCVMGSFTGYSMSKGELAIDTLKDCSGGKYKLNIEGGYPYSQTKLAQHVWCKERALTLPAGVTLNVTCPGAVPDTNIPGWQKFKDTMGCMFGLIRVLLGTRTVKVGAQPMAHLCGAAAMDGVSGKFLDWGMKTSYLIKRRPSPMELYPTQSTKPAPTTADAAQRKKLCDQTAAVMSEMRAKY